MFIALGNVGDRDVGALSLYCVDTDVFVLVVTDVMLIGFYVIPPYATIMFRCLTVDSVRLLRVAKLSARWHISLSFSLCHQSEAVR